MAYFIPLNMYRIYITFMEQIVARIGEGGVRTDVGRQSIFMIQMCYLGSDE